MEGLSSQLISLKVDVIGPGNILFSGTFLHLSARKHYRLGSVAVTHTTIVSLKQKARFSCRTDKKKKKMMNFDEAKTQSPVADKKKSTLVTTSTLSSRARTPTSSQPSTHSEHRFPVPSSKLH